MSRQQHAVCTAARDLGYIDLVARATGLGLEVAELAVAAILNRCGGNGRACVCSCHPHFSASHDDGFDCNCTWDDERRAQTA